MNFPGFVTIEQGKTEPDLRIKKETDMQFVSLFYYSGYANPQIVLIDLEFLSPVRIQKLLARGDNG